ncbi:MAG: NUDIX domain-containing protein [Deltaproteobacteria bacterium]|nr:NUDIX domain-containing protein [Deltaproteobacteria bacterium]
MPDLPAQTRLSATILLIRDADEELEVFMVERHHQIDFAEGALVFPGGKLEASDAALADHCRDAHLYSEAGNALRVAAIRETFEECGVLLARARGELELIGAQRLARISKLFRQKLLDDEASMLELVESEGLELACDLLIPFAHWITPEFMPKRFDTHFFLAEAPGDQLAAHDGFESVDSIWTTIPNALELERTGQRTIIFPTLENVKKLGRSRRVDEALRSAKRDPIVTVLPVLDTDAKGELWLEIPETAGYDTVRAPISALAGGPPGRGDES